MAHCYKFSLVGLLGAAPRDERLNVGVAVFLNGNLDVRLLRSLRKVSALSLAFTDESIRAASANLSDLDAQLSLPNDTPNERLARLQQISPFAFSSLGEFVASTPLAYEQEISGLMRAFVEPEPALRAGRGKATPLTSSLRRVFKSDRVLAGKGEDLSAHRVMVNVELASGLVADFVLKNGAMHIIETVDAASENSSAVTIMKNIGLAALTIEQARINYGEDDTRGRLVYQACPQTEMLATPGLLAAEHQGIELVNWSSLDDQRRLREVISSLAHALPRKSKGQPLNASAQPRFSIN